MFNKYILKEEIAMTINTNYVLFNSVLITEEPVRLRREATASRNNSNSRIRENTKSKMTKSFELQRSCKISCLFF